MDGFSLYVKGDLHLLIFSLISFSDQVPSYSPACLLARKINRYIRNRKASGDLATSQNTQEFRDLDAQIGTFILAFPPELRDPLAAPRARHRRTLDHDLMVGRVTTMSIRGFFVD